MLMRLAVVALLLLAGCGDALDPPPTMAPVDTPALPKGVTTKCRVEFEPIVLPTTAPDQVAGRMRDREVAQDAVDLCDGRRARAVRRLGETR